MSDLTVPLLLALVAGGIIAVATAFARRRDRRDRSRHGNLGDVSILGGGVPNFNDKSPLHSSRRNRRTRARRRLGRRRSHWWR